MSGFPFPVTERYCNVYGCMGIMRPTRELHHISSKDHRIFLCTKCGNKTPWLDKPDLNGAFAQLHAYGYSEYSGLSMMSDPLIYPPKLVRPRRR